MNTNQTRRRPFQQGRSFQPIILLTGKCLQGSDSAADYLRSVLCKRKHHADRRPSFHESRLGGNGTGYGRRCIEKLHSADGRYLVPTVLVLRYVVHQYCPNPDENRLAAQF